MNQETLKKLEKLLPLLEPEGTFLRISDFSEAFKALMSAMKSLRTENDTTYTKAEREINLLANKILTANRDIEDKIKDSKQKSEGISKEFAVAITAFKKELEEFKTSVRSGDDGYTPERGVDYFTDEDKKEITKEIVDTLEEKIPTIKTAEEIISEINKLPTDTDVSKIDASHIKNLPEVTKANGGGWRNLSQLHDVTISEPVNNNVLKYNSTTNQWENGVGGGSGNPGGGVGSIQYHKNDGTFDGFGTFNGTNALDLTGISINSAGITTNGLFQQSGDQASFDVAGTNFAVKTTTYNGYGLINADDTGLVSMGDFFGEGNNTSIALDDTAETVEYHATNGHTFIGKLYLAEMGANTSAGIDIHNNAAAQVAIFGAGGGTGTSLVGTTNIGSASADYIQITGGTGASTFTATGSSTNIDIALTPKGSGSVTAVSNIAANNGLFTTSVRAGAAGSFYWNGRTLISAPADGNLLAWDSANTSFGRFMLGGTTSSFPAIKRSSATIAFRLADDSAYTAITAAAGTFSGLTSANAGLVVADTALAGSGSLAGSAISATQTWNTSGAPTAIKLNVTNTASGAGALLMDLQVGSTSYFKVAKDGAITTNNGAINTGSGAITTSGNVSGNNWLGSTAVRAGASSIFYWNGRSQMQSPSDGVITMWNAATTDFSRLQFGGTTSSYPAIKRSSTELQTRLADDSGYAAIQSLYIRYGSGSPESVVTAPIGAIYSRTDGGAGTSIYVKESGTGNTGWIAK